MCNYGFIFPLPPQYTAWKVLLWVNGWGLFKMGGACIHGEHGETITDGWCVRGERGSVDNAVLAVGICPSEEWVSGFGAVLCTRSIFFFVKCGSSSVLREPFRNCKRFENTSPRSDVYLNSISRCSPHRVLFLFMPKFCDLLDDVRCLGNPSQNKDATVWLCSTQRNRKNKTEEKQNYALKTKIYIYIVVYKTTGWVHIKFKSKEINSWRKCTPIHKSANQTNKDKRLMRIDLSLIFFLFYLLECAHVLCKYCCSVFLSYKLEVTLSAIVSLKMWRSAICTPNW